MQCNECLIVSLPVILLIEPILHQYLVYFISFLRVKKPIFLILKVGMSIYPKQIDGGRFAMLFIEYSHLDISAFSWYFDPYCISEVIDFGEGDVLLVVFWKKNFEHAYIFVFFWTDVDLSDEGKGLQFEEDVDRRNGEVGGLPADDAAGWFVEDLCDVLGEVWGGD
jgi:hypothetical protein